MPDTTAISWTDTTWNPTFGCSRVSEGCRFCYAERIALKFGHSKKPWTARNAPDNVVLKRHKLRDPYRWKDPRRVFVNSMSDLFHEEIPFPYLEEIFTVMHDLPQHRFQILTKRHERLLELAPLLRWTPNIWMGVSVESPRWTSRIDLLRRTPAHIKFISFEPLIERIPSPDLTGIDWAIVGGESGSTRREMPHVWAREIRDACLRQDTAFFFKQSSAFSTERGVALQHADGSYWIWQQFPDLLRKPVEVPGQINGSTLGLYLTSDLENVQGSLFREKG